MKIDQNLKSPVAGAAVDDAKRPAKKAVTDTASPTDSNVSLSSLSSHMNAIEQGFAETPVVNSAKVEALKLAMASGHFKVDAGKVADRLLDTVRELIRAHKA
jgi:negative regulator of flagellin synthesis FlgM